MRNQSVADMRDDRDVFQALADPTRRAILEVLRAGSQPVHGIAARLCDQPSRDLQASAHPEGSRPVKEVKVGRNRLYAFHPEPLRDIDEWLAHYRHMWQHQLRNLKRYVEQKRKEH